MKKANELINSIVNTVVESLTKHSANLDEIMDNIDQMAQILNSKEFLTKLVDDLLNGQRNVAEWKIIDQSGSLEDVDYEGESDSFDINYTFDFKYKYGNKIIPLSITISGDVYFSKTPYRSASYMQPAEGGEAVIDDNELRNLDITLMYDDSDELNIKWLDSNPKLKIALVNQLIPQALS